NVWKHVVNGAWDIECFQNVESGVHVGQCPEQTEQKRCQSDQLRLPLSEDHNRKGKESESCHTVFKFPFADTCCDVDDSSQTSEKSGNQDARITHFVYVDSNGIRCLRMLAARPQSQSKPGFIENHVRNDQKDDSQDHKPAYFKVSDFKCRECFPLIDILNGRGNIVYIFSHIDCFDNDSGRRCSKKVHGCSDQCLVCLEVDGRYCKQKGLDHTTDHT